MLDITFIRNNLDIVKKAARDKNRTVDWDRLLALDEKRRELIGKSEALRKERNEISKTKGASDRGKQIKVELKSVEDELRQVEEEYTIHMLTVPNVPDPEVPVGPDASANVEIRRWGDIPKFDFPVRDHNDIATRLDLIDFERGVKVSGFRGYFLKGIAARMELGIMNYALTKLAEKGYTPLIAPILLKEFTLIGIAQFPWGKDEVYHLEKDDLYLAGTAEQPVTSYHSGEVLSESELPKKYVAYSPCYRREAGSYGKDTKGAYRVHQFSKIEQVIVTTADIAHSYTLHEELLANAEELLQDLGLTYRVMLMSTGDMGEPQVKKYDIETWMPGRNDWGETMSNSFMGDFQARRLKIRYRTKDGQTLFCHTLNNTAIASPRILIAILENYQQKDGSVVIPEVLTPYVGTDRISASK